MMKCMIILSFAVLGSSLRLNRHKSHRWEADAGSDPYTAPFKRFIYQEIEYDFPAIAKHTNFAEQNHAARTEDVPCDAQLMLGFQDNKKNGSTIFQNKVNAFMNEVAFAAYGDFSVAMWSPGKFGPLKQPWSTFFENSLPVCHHTENDIDKFPRVDHHIRSFFKALATKDEDFHEKIMRSTYQTYYKYNTKTKNAITKTLQAYHLPPKYYGVHIATVLDAEGNHVYGQYAPAQAYGNAVLGSLMEQKSTMQLAEIRAIQAAEDILSRKEDGIRTVWLSTNEPTAKKVLEETLNPNGQKTYRIESLKGLMQDSQKMLHDLSDIEALRSSAHFIGTSASPMGNMVYWLRPKGSPVTTMDTSFSEHFKHGPSTLSREERKQKRQAGASGPGNVDDIEKLPVTTQHSEQPVEVM